MCKRLKSYTIIRIMGEKKEKKSEIFKKWYFCVSFFPNPPPDFRTGGGTRCELRVTSNELSPSLDGGFGILRRVDFFFNL